MPLVCLLTRPTDENDTALHISQTKLPRTEKRRESSHESRVRYSGGVNHRGAGVRLIGLEDSGLVPVWGRVGGSRWVQQKRRCNSRSNHREGDAFHQKNQLPGDPIHQKPSPVQIYSARNIMHKIGL